jgi:AAA+ ATPase superfamily predicted ATPase
MKFIDRIEELRRLDHLASLPEGGVVVIWGRRRVGKTRLLLEWIHRYRGVYYTADESTPAMQRKYFSLALGQVLPDFSSVEYPDWTSFFTHLAKEARQNHWTGPLVIDELPYLIAMSPELPSVLQKFIDVEAKRAKLVIALSGSSQRMMQGAVLNASAPLYGRASEIIKLAPISAGYLGEALGIKSSREIVESYAIWGGIPRYWELVKNCVGSFFETIDRIVLNPMGPLNDEPNRLLLEELPPAISLRPILDAIGLGAHRLSEIASRVGQPATSLVRPIQRLIDLDLIEREVPFSSHDHHSKRSLYKIKDPFIRFWFEIVAPRRSYFAQTLPSHRQKWLKENLSSLFSIAWEELCRQALPLLSQQWEEPIFPPAKRYWHGQGPEWDILSESIDHQALLIGEAKWLVKKPSPSWIQQAITELQSKGLPPVERPKHIKPCYALFVPEKPKNLLLPKGVKVVDAKEVISVLRM